jgi:hypothetical protein
MVTTRATAQNATTAAATMAIPAGVLTNPWWAPDEFDCGFVWCCGWADLTGALRRGRGGEVVGIVDRRVGEATLVAEEMRRVWDVRGAAEAARTKKRVIPMCDFISHVMGDRPLILRVALF